jgi:transposase
LLRERDVQELKELQRQGMSIQAISKLTGWDRKTIRKYMQALHWPLRIAQHDERDCANPQVLLVADIFVGSDQHIKSGGLSGLRLKRTYISA